MNAQALVECLTEPVAIQLATATEALAPRNTRGFGARFAPASAELAVNVVDAQARDFLLALRSSDRVAVNLGHPITFRGVQAKGRLLAIEDPSEEARQEAARYYAAFVEVVAALGVTAQQCRGFFHSGPARRVRLRVERVFDQTPGPNAGREL